LKSNTSQSCYAMWETMNIRLINRQWNNNSSLRCFGNCFRFCEEGVIHSEWWIFHEVENGPNRPNGREELARIATDKRGRTRFVRVIWSIFGQDDLRGRPISDIWGDQFWIVCSQNARPETWSDKSSNSHLMIPDSGSVGDEIPENTRGNLLHHLSSRETHSKLLPSARINPYFSTSGEK
jgi:hypothetical protein